MATVANPFRYGALALDEAFTDREREIAELRADVRNGQDVVVFAPRRYGKSSLIWRVAQELVRRKVLVAPVDLMTTPTGQAGREARRRSTRTSRRRSIGRASGCGSSRACASRPRSSSTPTTARSASASKRASRPRTSTRRSSACWSCRASSAAERGRRVALILDEFQEIVDIDPDLPKLMRAVFQEQPEVAHVYLGSKRHMMRADLQRRERAVLAQRQADGAGRDRARAVRALHRRALRARPGGAIEPGRGRSAPARRPAGIRTPPRSCATSSGS